LATAISWLKGSLLPPKPPPFEQATTAVEEQHADVELREEAHRRAEA
jgi:hypothetical protein